MKFFRLLLCCVLFSTLAATMCLAQETTSQEGQAEYTLGEIVVRGSADSIENSLSVTEVTAEELKNSGARTLSDAFKLVPGITTRTAADGTCRIDIRGMRTRNVKLLLNGIPFQSTLDGQFDPDTIPVDNIALIKITRGASSVLYGNDGNAGVIDIITKKGSKDFHGSVGAMAGEGDLYQVKSTVAGANGKLDFYAGANYLTRNSYAVANGFDKNTLQSTDSRENSDREHLNLLTNLTYQATDDTTLGVVLNTFSGYYGKPPSTRSTTGDVFAKTDKYERVEEYDGIDLQMALDHEFNSTFDTRLMLYGSKEYTETSRYSDNTYSSYAKKGSFKSKATSTTVGLNNQWGYNTDSFGRFVLAVMGERQNYYEDGFTMTSTTKSVDINADSTISNYSAAIQDDLSPIEDLHVSLGFGLNGQSRTDDSTGACTYALAANYQLFEGTNLRASQARKIRTPSVQNLYDSSAGNKDLASEITWHYEVGVTQELPLNSSLDFALYRIDAENYIEKDSNDIYQNFDKYRFQGFETTLTSKLLDNLTTQLGYSYLESQNLSDNAQTKRLQYRPRHKITGSVTYVAPTDTTVFASVRFVSDQYAVEGRDTMRMSDYALVDFKVSQPVTDALSVYVGADNLFDADYSESYGFPRPGRVFYTGLDYTF